MKTIKFLGFFLSAVLTVFGMSSCINSDDDSSSSLTPEQKQQCYLSVAGPHSGKMVYISGKTATGTNKTDSVEASWNVTSDSTMIFTNISSKAIASAIDTTTTEHKEIREAIAAQPSKSMSCYIGFVNTNPVQWLINPTGITYNVTYGGKVHEIKFLFYANSYYSFGQYNSSTKVMQLQLVTYGAYVDGTLDNGSVRLVKSNMPILFVQK